MAKKSEDQKPFLVRHWKKVLNVVTILALLALVYFIRHQLVSTFKDLNHLALGALVLLIPLQAWKYDAQARIYRRLFGTTGHKFSYKFMLRSSIELSFVNTVFPSGGISGVSYLSVMMRKYGISAGRSALVQIMKMVLIFVAFEGLLIIGMLFLAAGGKVNGYTILVGTMMTTLIVVTSSAFTFVIGSKSRINALFTMATRVINKIIHAVRRNHPETISIERARYVFDELHDNYLLFRHHYKELRAPLMYAGFFGLSEILSVFVVFIAFGFVVNIGAVILAYAVANLAGVISVLPGGAGIYEILMTGVLAVAGVPPAIGLPVAVAYRVFSAVLQVPPGYYFYQKSLHNPET
jgi:uncharacterized protein (TIRG00374 family)